MSASRHRQLLKFALTAVMLADASITQLCTIQSCNTPITTRPTAARVGWLLIAPGARLPVRLAASWGREPTPVDDEVEPVDEPPAVEQGSAPDDAVDPRRPPRVGRDGPVLWIAPAPAPTGAGADAVARGRDVALGAGPIPGPLRARTLALRC